MGGQLALFAATLNPAVGACVNFYGIHPNVKPDYGSWPGRCLGLYAERDGFVTPAVARQVDADIRAAGKSSEIHVYPGVDHAFFNDERPDVYDRAAAEDAWRADAHASSATTCAGASPRPTGGPTVNRDGSSGDGSESLRTGVGPPRRETSLGTRVAPRGQGDGELARYGRVEGQAPTSAHLARRLTGVG